jgi:hypothetical protein
VEEFSRLLVIGLKQDLLAHGRFSLVNPSHLFEAERLAIVSAEK